MSIDNCNIEINHFLETSAPEVLVLGVVAQLREWGAVGAEELDGRPENVTFSMPKELRIRNL